jgi:hypothetical protein
MTVDETAELGCNAKSHEMLEFAAWKRHSERLSIAASKFSESIILTS